MNDIYGWKNEWILFWMLPTNVIFVENWTKETRIKTIYVGFFQNKSTNEIFKSQFKPILHISSIWNIVNNKTLGMSKRWHSVTPPLALVGNQNMGKRMEKSNWQNRWMGCLQPNDGQMWK